MKIYITLLLLFAHQAAFCQEDFVFAEMGTRYVAKNFIQKKATQRTNRFTAFYHNNTKKIMQESAGDEPFGYEATTSIEMNSLADYIFIPQNEMRAKLTRIKLLQQQQQRQSQWQFFLLLLTQTGAPLLYLDK